MYHGIGWSELLVLFAANPGEFHRDCLSFMCLQAHPSLSIPHYTNTHPHSTCPSLWSHWTWIWQQVRHITAQTDSQPVGVKPVLFTALPRIQADSAEGVQQSHTHTSVYHRVNCMVNHSQDTLVGYKSSLKCSFLPLLYVHKQNVFVSLCVCVCILHKWLIAIITNAVIFLFNCCSVSQQTRKTLQQCYNIWTSGIERQCILL